MSFRDLKEWWRDNGVLVEGVAFIVGWAAFIVLLDVASGMFGAGAR